MAKEYRVVITLSLPPSLLSRIDEKAGPRKRSQFLEKAAERELSGQTIEAVLDRLIQEWCIAENAYQDSRKRDDAIERQALEITANTYRVAFAVAIGDPTGTAHFNAEWHAALTRGGWALNKFGVWIPSEKEEVTA